MKKLVTVMMMLAVGILICYADGKLNGGAWVGTSSTPVMPPRGLQSAMALTNPSTNAAGAIVLANGRLYMATEEAILTDGTWGPTHSFGIVSNYMAIPSGSRDGLVICNTSDNAVWLSIGQAATTNNGIYLASGASWSYTGDKIQEPIYAIAESVSNRVTFTEW